MPIVNRVADLQPDIQAWRRDIHQHPELLYDVHRTAAFVAERLREFGCDEVATGLGRTGVVGVIKGRKPANGASVKVIGLRADMDALPVEEETGLPYASKTPGKMHACGHDGHTAMLLGAARYLAETRNFDGTAVVIFQPAEEGGAGGKAMVDDGLMTRFGVDEVYGMHNSPLMPLGAFGLRPGPIMAAADYVTIEIEGVGGHAARPHLAVDPVLAAAHIIIAIQSIVSRSVDPLQSAVISINVVQAGTADNVIPPRVTLEGTARTLSEDVRVLVEKRLKEVVENTAADDENSSKRLISVAFRQLAQQHPRVFDPDAVWARIDAIVARTMAAIQPYLLADAGVAGDARRGHDEASAGYIPNCFQLFGFDVFLDDAATPWLLEINCRPSLQVDAPVDAAVKSVVADALVRMVQETA